MKQAAWLGESRDCVSLMRHMKLFKFIIIRACILGGAKYANEKIKINRQIQIYRACLIKLR